MALLVVLETLSPLERAAFVLREVFDRPYAEVAATLGRSEQAVRQLVHRARGRVDDGHARFSADVATHTQVVSQFLAACQGADLEALLAVLAPDVVIISDSGGQAQAPRRPVYGRDKVARLLVGFAGRVPEGLTFGLEYFNGSLGIVARIDGRPFAAMAVTVAEGTVQSLQLIANPEKLAFLQRGGLQPSAVTTQMPARPVLPGWASVSTWVPAAERIVTPAVVVSTAAASAQPRAAA